MSKIVLASKSPRRQELLKLISLDFEVFPDDSPEIANENLSPEKYVCFLSRNKCLNVAEKFDDDCIVIGADTIVVKDGKIMGKPSSFKDAKRMLEALSDDVHTVYTGVTVSLKKEEKVVTFFEKTDVYFYNLSEENINEYVKSGEPMDKAGAYGIQEKGALFVEKINGDYNNVVGLPVAKLMQVLKKEFYFR